MSDDSECINTLSGIIGEAVSGLLKLGEAPHRENILTMLQLMGVQSEKAHVKALCLRAQKFMMSRR